MKEYLVLGRSPESGRVLTDCRHRVAHSWLVAKVCLSTSADISREFEWEMHPCDEAPRMFSKDRFW